MQILTHILRNQYLRKQNMTLFSIIVCPRFQESLDFLCKVNRMICVTVLNKSCIIYDRNPIPSKQNRRKVRQRMIWYWTSGYQILFLCTTHSHMQYSQLWPIQFLEKYQAHALRVRSVIIGLKGVFNLDYCGKCGNFKQDHNCFNNYLHYGPYKNGEGFIFSTSNILTYTYQASTLYFRLKFFLIIPRYKKCRKWIF